VGDIRDPIFRFGEQREGLAHALTRHKGGKSLPGPLLEYTAEVKPTEVGNVRHGAERQRLPEVTVNELSGGCA